VAKYLKPLIDITAAGYYSDLANMLEEENRNGQTVRVNADKTAYYGFEAGLQTTINKFAGIGTTLTLEKYKIKYSAANLNAAGNYPQTTASAYIIAHPFVLSHFHVLQTLELIPSMEYVGRRYGSKNMINLNAAIILPEHTLFNLRLRLEINDYIGFNAGIENLFDTNYVLNNSALPMSGRSFYINMTAKY
jgi:outer membrane receptor protein involved in Fe transport